MNNCKYSLIFLVAYKGYVGNCCYCTGSIMAKYRVIRVINGQLLPIYHACEKCADGWLQIRDPTNKLTV